MRSLEDLLELQTLDSGIDRLLDRRSHLPALAKFRAVHRRLEKLDADIAAAQATKRELDLAEGKAEGEMKLDEEKVRREEQRLFAGVGLTAKDLGHLRDEVTMLRERISHREDEALALIEQQQAIVASLESLGAERDMVRADKAALEAEIASEWKVMDEEIARLEARKRETVPAIDPDLLALYREFYAGEPFVRVLPEGERPTTRSVTGSNFCDIAVVSDPRTGRAVCVSTLDNLGKGGSANGIQNLNIMMGWDERTGLEAPPVYP